MSTRTIIEINHDFLHTLLDHKAIVDTLLRELGGASIPSALAKAQWKPYEYAPGIRILGQRHHSEPDWIQERAR